MLELFADFEMSIDCWYVYGNEFVEEEEEEWWELLDEDEVDEESIDELKLAGFWKE